MKKSYRNNFIALVFLHLFLLVFPLISKTVHVHHGLLAHVDYSGRVSFNTAGEYCPIYNFEFYSFIESPVFKATGVLACAPVYNLPVPRVHFLSVPDYFSLRAPPAA